MPSISVVTGIILVLLFYSLLATIMMEVASGFLSMRGKHLEKILKGLLSSADRREELFHGFKDNALYQQMSGRIYGKDSPPSYLSAPMFRSILFKLVEARKEGASFKEKIEHLPDEQLKLSLLQLWEEGSQVAGGFGEQVENWYNEVMERASGWYKRNIQKGLMIIGLVIAVGFNVDVLSVYSHLVKFSQTDMDQLTELATTVSQQNFVETPVAGTAVDSLDVQPTAEASAPTYSGAPDSNQLDTKQLYELMNAKLGSLENPLGLGWENVEPTSDITFWLFKLFGWLVTALCISKGAPFWFDLLKKVVNFRDSGNPPVRIIQEVQNQLPTPARLSASAPVAAGHTASPEPLAEQDKAVG